MDLEVHVGIFLTNWQPNEDPYTPHSSPQYLYNPLNQQRYTLNTSHSLTCINMVFNHIQCLHFRCNTEHHFSIDSYIPYHNQPLHPRLPIIMYVPCVLRYLITDLINVGMVRSLGRAMISSSGTPNTLAAMVCSEKTECL